jgi:Tfp pilus assembly protein PilO
MRPLSPREKALIVIAAAALILVVYLFALLLPMQERSRDLARQEASLREQIAAGERMYREGQTANGEIAALRAEVENLSFPQPDVKVGTVRILEGLASEVKVTITSIRPGEPESVDGAIRYPVTLKLETQFGKAIRLLYELEQPGRRLWVEGLEITSARQTGDLLQVTVYVAAYQRAKESEAKSVEA